MRYDIAAYGPNGGLVAVFQNRLRRGTDKQWAAEFRANLFALFGAPDRGFFAIVTPDRIYLWPAGEPSGTLPSFDIDALPIFEPYYARVGASVQTIMPMAFDMIVAWWLRDVARHARPEIVQGLDATGLADALRGAEVELEDAA